MFIPMVESSWQIFLGDFSIPIETQGSSIDNVFEIQLANDDDHN